MKDERDTWLESSGAFIMPQLPDSTSSGHAYVGKIGLGTFEPVPVPEIRYRYPTIPFFGTLLSVITKTFISMKNKSKTLNFNILNNRALQFFFLPEILVLFFSDNQMKA